MKTTLNRFLSAPWWQGVSAIAGVLLAIAAIAVTVLAQQVEESQRRDEIASLTSNIRGDLDQTGTISRSSTADVESEPWPMTFAVNNFGPGWAEFVTFELHSGSNRVTPG